MADVADGAGLSRGIVNFHFESKEKLLVATLQYMADEYSAHWRAALQKAGDDPARQLGVWSRPTSTVRSATSASSRPGAPSGARPSRGRPIRRCAAPATKAYQNVFIDLCARLKADGGYDFDPHATALGFSAMLEGLWLRLMMGTEDVTRETAHHAASEFLASVFPRHFPRRRPAASRSPD